MGLPVTDAPALELCYMGERVLRSGAKRVARVDSEVRQLCRDMFQAMYAAEGIGLAAVQVGITKQIIVVDIGAREDGFAPLALINPVIKKSTPDLVVGQEGCLSIPNVYLDVRRPAGVEVSYKDELGRPCNLKASGLLARVIQHEIDHLNGILFVDRVENTLALTQELAAHRFSLEDVRPLVSAA